MNTLEQVIETLINTKKELHSLRKENERLKEENRTLRDTSPDKDRFAILDEWIEYHTIETELPIHNDEPLHAEYVKWLYKNHFPKIGAKEFRQYMINKSIDKYPLEERETVKKQTNPKLYYMLL